MADAQAATNPGMDRYNRYYNTVLAQLQQDMGPERSDSQLKNYLTRLIRPSYDQAIAQRQQQTGQANAMIDTDAASRGMGTSTWVTDAKNRQRNNEANDIATLNSNYASTLYDALLNQISQRDQLRMNLMNQAQGIAGNMYDRWKAEEDALNAGSGGGGGGGGEGGSPGRPRENPKPTGTGFGDDLLNDETKPTATTPQAYTPSSPAWVSGSTNASQGAVNQYVNNLQTSTDARRSAGQHTNTTGSERASGATAANAQTSSLYPKLKLTNNLMKKGSDR